MTQTEQHTVVGIFNDSQAARDGIDALLQAGIPEEHLGFAARTQEEHLESARQQIERHGHHSSHGKGPNSFSRGIIGGVMGVVDLLLVPFTGPADATAILGSTLPIAEEAIDHLPYPGSRDKNAGEPLQRPDDALRTTQSAPTTEETVHDPALTTPPTTGEEQTTPTGPGEVATDEDEQTEQRHERITGGVTGGVIGGALGAAAALLLPGVGPIIAGGVIATILGGGAIGSIAGSFLSTFDHMGIPKEHAQRYVNEVQAGRIIVTAQDIAQPQAVADILRRYHPLDIQIH